MFLQPALLIHRCRVSLVFISGWSSLITTGLRLDSDSVNKEFFLFLQIHGEHASRLLFNVAFHAFNMEERRINRSRRYKQDIQDLNQILLQMRLQPKTPQTHSLLSMAEVPEESSFFTVNCDETYSDMLHN